MFSGTYFTGDISKWDVSRVINMNIMFMGAVGFKSNISKWDVVQMKDMFMVATSFSIDISQWDVSKVINMHGMFIGAKAFNQELCGAAWVESKATKVFMFQGSDGWINIKESVHTRTHFGYHDIFYTTVKGRDYTCHCLKNA